MSESLVAGVYEKSLDRESAFEKIKGRTSERLATVASSSAEDARPQMDRTEAVSGQGGGLLEGLGNIFGGGARRTRASAGEQIIRSAASAIGREVGRQVIRGVLGSIFGGSRR